MRSKPKFEVGQMVEVDGAGENMEIDRCHFDPSDGWEYHLKGEHRMRFHFEENLRTPAQTGASGEKK